MSLKSSNETTVPNGSVLFADDEEVNSSSGTPLGRVSLTPENDEEKDRRRFLTAKYQKQQLGMIRRRIAIEDWIVEELSNVFGKDDEDNDDDDHDVSIDLDEVLSFHEDGEREKYIRDKLSQSSQTMDKTSADMFVVNLITKLHEL